jgi:hypothetical protein
MDEPVSSHGIMKLRCMGLMWSHFVIELVYYNDWYCDWPSTSCIPVYVNHPGSTLNPVERAYGIT